MTGRCPISLVQRGTYYCGLHERETVRSSAKRTTLSPVCGGVFDKESFLCFGLNNTLHATGFPLLCISDLPASQHRDNRLFHKRQHALIMVRAWPEGPLQHVRCNLSISPDCSQSALIVPHVQASRRFLCEMPPSGP